MEGQLMSRTRSDSSHFKALERFTMAPSVGILCPFSYREMLIGLYPRRTANFP